MSPLLLFRLHEEILELFQQVYDTGAFASPGKIVIPLVLGVKHECMGSGALPDFGVLIHKHDIGVFFGGGGS